VYQGKFILTLDKKIPKKEELAYNKSLRFNEVYNYMLVMKCYPILYIWLLTKKNLILSCSGS